VIAPYGDILTIGECWPCTPEVADEVVGEGALSVAFHFDYHLLNRMDPVPFKSVMQKWEESLRWRRPGSWNCYYLSNHDMPRQIDRFGSRENWAVSAKMLAVFLLTAPGMVFLYQGEEIGMTNVSYDAIDEYRDIQCINEYKHLIELGRSHDDAFLQAQHMSRDNARTPMQWNNSAHGGFTSGAPWLAATYINVEDQLDRDGSILRSYQQLIALRKEHTTLMFGEYRQLLPEHPHLSATLREDDNGTYLVLLNLTSQETQWPELGISLENAMLLYANVPYAKMGIPGYACYIFRII
jgi:oligo-1,6-glucosidase